MARPPAARRSATGAQHPVHGYSGDRVFLLTAETPAFIADLEDVTEVGQCCGCRLSVAFLTSREAPGYFKEVVWKAGA